MNQINVQPNNNFLKRTHQFKKLVTLYSLIGVVCLIRGSLFLWEDKIGYKYQDVLPYLHLIMLILFISTFYLIKCPKCGNKVLLEILKREKAYNFFREIFIFKKCPSCGH